MPYPARIPPLAFVSLLLAGLIALTSSVDAQSPAKGIPQAPPAAIEAGRKNIPSAVPSPAPNGPATSSPAVIETPPAAIVTKDVSTESAAEGKTGMLYLRDMHGKFVPVPNVNLEEFLKRNDPRRLAEEADDRPRATLQQLSLVGRALKQSAALNAVFEIRVHDEGAGWLRIPLALREAAWEAGIQYAGSGEYFVDFDREADEYVCWLRAAANTKHTLTASIVTPIVGAGQERRLALSLPDAAASVLRLDVPSGRVAVVESRGTPEADVRGLDGGTSRIETLGAKGDYLLSWRESDRTGEAIQSILECTGLQRIRIDGRTISTNARLTVRSYGAEFDRIRVRIPPKSVLAGLPGKGMTLSTVPGANGETIEVLLDAKTLGPLEIPLQTERVLDIAKPNDPLELAGFEVLEALPHRQGGTIGIETLGDWQLVWGKTSRVRQAVDFPDKTNPVPPAAIWEYVGQPYQLEVRVQPRKTFLTGDLEHRLRCFENHAELTTTIRYQVRGARMNVVTMQLNGWTIEEVGPETVVNGLAVTAGTGDPTRIPLKTPLIGNFEIFVRARRTLGDGVAERGFPLPVATLDLLNSAELNVAAADRIQIDPLGEQCANLTPLRENSPDSIVDETSWNYRIEKQPATFAAKIHVVPRVIEAVVLGKCSVGLRETQVEQLLEYRVHHGTLNEVRTTMPGTLPGQTPIVWKIDGEVVTPRGLPRYDEKAKVWEWIFPVEPSRPAGLTLQANYALPHALGTENTTSLQIPLVLPVCDKILRQEIGIEPAAGVVLGTTKLSKNWVFLDGETDTERVRRFDLRATKPQPEVALTGESQADSLGARMIVERTWMQTWLSQNERLERVVYRLQGNSGPERIELPERVSPANVQLLWNRNPLRFQTEGVRTIAPIYPSSIVAGRQVLEMRYRYDDAPSLWNVKPHLPRWDPTLWDGGFYWQILAPERWTLVASPADMSDENSWSFGQDAWGRVPELDDSQLEAWSGGAISETRSTGAATYLFAAIGSKIEHGVWLFPRTLVIWIGTACGFGLAAIVRWRRRALTTPVMLGFAAASVFVGAAFPHQVLLFGQFALLGFPLIGIAILLKRLMGIERAAEYSANASPERTILERPADREPPAAQVHTGSTATALLAAMERPAS